MDPMTASQALPAGCPMQHMHHMCHHPVLLMLAFLIWAGILIVNFTMIFRKAGYPWALGLLMAVPLVNVVLLFILGFSKWPILRSLEEAKKEGEKKA